MTAFGLWFGGSHIGFGTHMPILASAVLQAHSGPVLEYGLGFYSTPLLHLLCQEMGREMLSLEGDAEWAKNFEEFNAGFHRVVAMHTRDARGTVWAPSEPIVDDFAQEWAVVFIDHGPDWRREIDCARLAQKAEFVVVHDWGEDHPPCQRMAAMFKYKWVSKMGLATAVLSNVRPFELGYR